MVPITLQVNGQEVKAEIAIHERLLDFLRNELKLLGAKEGCGHGECGTCTVIMDGQVVNSCLILAVQAHGANITTIEGLGNTEELHPLQESFIEHGAVQCGYCTPGMILSAKNLLDKNPHPTRKEIQRSISGNLCRCTGYQKIVEAIEAVAEGRKGR